MNISLHHEKLPDKLKELTGCIIGSAYRVANTLGAGFLEKVYENALFYELGKGGLQVSQQHLIPVYYDGIMVGDYIVDLLVEQSVLVELKVVRSLENVHTAQCINYLKATRMPICLLLNFGLPRVEVKRVINTDYDFWQATKIEEKKGEEI